MKKLAGLLLLFTSLLIAGSSFWFFSDTNRRPSPTDRALSHEEKAEHKKARADFFEKMHRAAPDVNWRIIERNTRKEKAEKRFQALQARNLSKTAADFGKDSLANGKIIGHWREVGSVNQAGRTTWAEYDFENNVLYASSAGGNLWKGNLQGSSWEVLNDLQQIPGLNTLISIPQSNNSRLLALASDWGVEGVRYSDDGGLTWTISTGLGNVLNWGFAARLVALPDSLHTLYVLAYEWDYDPANWSSVTTLYRSTDQGVSFSKFANFHSFTYGDIARLDIWADSHSPGSLFVLENNHVFRIDGGGTTLTAMGNIPLIAPEGNAHIRGIQTPGGTILYALYENGDSSNVYRSVLGAPWTYQGSVPTRLFSRGSFACSSVNPNVLYAGGVNAYRSTNGGASWQLVNEWYEYYGDPDTKLHADIPAINPFKDSAGNEFVIINTDGGAYISYDQLQTVQNISLNGLHVGQFYSTYTHRINTNIVYGGTQDQGYQRAKVDNGEALVFDQLISGDYGHLVSGDSGQSIWTNYPGFTMYYPNAANTTQQLFRDFDGSGHLWLPPLIADPVMANRSYLGGGSLDGSGANIIQQTVVGGVISVVEQPYDFSEGTAASISAMGISPQDANYRYVMTDNEKFFFSFDGGQNWFKSPQGAIPGSHYFYGNVILPSPKQFGRLYIGGSGYSNSPVYVSNNHGNSFTPINNGLPQLLIFDMDMTPDERMVFAATSIGPYLYIPADNQWYPMEGLHAPDQTYWTVEYIPALNVARFGTYGRGIWDFTVCDSLSPQPVSAFQTFLTGNGTSIQFIDKSSGGQFIQWEFGDGQTALTPNPLHNFGSSGVYEVRQIVSTHCQSDTFSQTLYLVATGTEDLLSDRQLKVFPNPNTGWFEVENTGGKPENLHLEVVDIAGKVIWKKSEVRVEAQGLFLVRLTDTPAGIYFLRAIPASGGKPYVQKLIIR
ncbi:MAG: T9SS type A sorting domain-containing protein [Bacteroidia bacterium]|nr:T9SS type A sorting domain-containing protein [Bacteroidia bacterium]